jgi:hypothetical protein
VMLKLATGYVVTHTFFSPTTKMVNVVLTDGEEDAHLRRPKRNPKPSATLLNDPDQATLPSQQQAIENFCIAEAARRTAETKLAIEAIRKATLTPNSSPSHGSSPMVSLGPVPSSSTSQHKSKRAYVSEEEESGDEREESGDEREDARTNPKPPGTFLSFGSDHC